MVNLISTAKLARRMADCIRHAAPHLAACVAMDIVSSRTVTLYKASTTCALL